MSFSDALIQCLDESEECRLLAYDDARPDHVLHSMSDVHGTLTIGWGHTGKDVYVGQTCTQEQADAWRDADLTLASRCVDAALPGVSLTPGQRDAMIDFEYNTGKLAGSTIQKKILAGDLAGVASELYRVDPDGTEHGWIFAKGGVKMPGLITRRKREIALWNS
ncbi:MAG: lysozyme [Patescibacteria group bacterium]|nr:lysozyme [Patescibacteria group bacterium]